MRRRTEAAVTDADIARVFREEHGRAVAVLVRAFGDIDAAEDAVQDAFAVACERCSLIRIVSVGIGG